MTKVFFIADVHLGHAGVIAFDKRPWDDVEQMNEGMIERWNEVVKPCDHVYILGDLCWRSGSSACELVKRLNGNLHLIRGNHDRIKNLSYRNLFVSIKDYDCIKVTLEDKSQIAVALSHYPIPLYNGHLKDAIHLYGHVHNTSEQQDVEEMVALLHGKNIRCEMFNAWCGFYDWRPATLDEILARNHYVK